MKTVRVALGYSNVPLPDGLLHNPGPDIQLSDYEYDSLPDFIKQQLIVVQALPEPFSRRAPASTSSFTNRLIQDILASMGVGLVLGWDGNAYQPSAYIGSNDRTKIFIGPTDPSTIPTATLNKNDQWVVTS